MKKNVFVVPMLLLLLFVAGTSTAAEEPAAVVIGATVSQTGHFSAEVGPFKNLMEAWAGMVNDRGGINLAGRRLPLKFVIYDDKSEEATARKYYERLVTEDQVHLLLGPYSSPLTLAASTAGENHQRPFVAVCANSPKIYDRGFKWLVGLIDLGPRYTYRYWEMIKAENRAKTVSFVIEDTLHPQGVAAGSRKLAEEAGLKVLSSHVLPADALDMTAIVARLKEADPDIIYVSANIPLAVRFMKQARELKLNPREYHCIHHGGVFREALGEAADQVVGQSYWVQGMPLGQAGFMSEVLARAGVSEVMYPWAPAYVAAFQVIQAAIERCGSLEPEKLMATLKALEMETVLGRAAFTPTGYGTINTYPSQIRGQRYEVIWPAGAATGQHVYPRALWP